MASEEGAVVESSVNQCKYSKRVVLKAILNRSDGGLGLVGERVVIGGWVQSSKEKPKDLPQPSNVASTAITRVPKEVDCVEFFQCRVPLFRSIMKVLGVSNFPVQEKLNLQSSKPASPSIAYLQVTDGSCVPSLQVMVESSLAPLIQVTPIGSSILVEGVLKLSSASGRDIIELKVEKILHVGKVDHATYPLARTNLPWESLMGYPHLLPRTTMIASVTRIRSVLFLSTHKFFEKHGFLYVQMPVITTTDAKGFSEKFQVTSLFGKADMKEERKAIDDTGSINLDVIRDIIKEKSKRIEELKRSNSNKETLFAALQDLQKANELVLQLEPREKLNHETPFKVGKMDFSKDFFSSQTYLTTSAQLHLESYACALGNVYTFGPTFRAKKSQSTKHLAELWMVEIEMAFSELEDVIDCAEDYLKFLCIWILENCSDDMKFLSKRIDKTSINRLESVASCSFERITYTEAVDILQKVTDKTFESKIEWGISLTKEHESYLTDEIYKRPVIIYNYPKEVKPFYMRLNDDGKTVAAVNIVVPEVGTLIRGGQREERIDKISSRIKELSLPIEQYEWYLDLRRHGTITHSGFSLGFDHMVLLATGLTDIRDAIPFPRSCGNLNN